MSRGVIFDEPDWWQRPRWQIAAAAALALVALPIWWLALSPVEDAPVALNTPAPAPAALRSAQATLPAEPAPAAPSLLGAPSQAASAAALRAPPLSTLVAPGVHVTPLSVPPGTVPMPAGPKAEDSEAEN